MTLAPQNTRFAKGHLSIQSFMMFRVFEHTQADFSLIPRETTCIPVLAGRRRKVFYGNLVQIPGTMIQERNHLDNEIAA